MKNLLFILQASISLVLFGTASVSAQIQQAWVAKYNNNGITNGNHQALKMALDSSGNIYVLGVSANAMTNTGYAVVKYAPNGNQIWAARYDSTNYPAATPTGFALDSSNNIVVTGSAVTVKFDSQGDFLWAESYTGTSIVTDPGQNVYITGVSGNYTTMKLNPTGSNIWSQTWLYEGLPNISQAIAVDSSTNVYVAGRGTQGAPVYDNDVHVGILKYDPKGNQLWDLVDSYGNMDYDVQVVGLQLDSLNNVYIEANYLGGDPDPFTTFLYNSNGVGGAIADNPTGSIGSLAYALAAR